MPEGLVLRVTFYSQIALVGSAALSSLFSSQQEPGVKTVDLGYAKYQTDASLAEGVTSFLGVRYAAPPIGNLRFHAPQAPSAIEELQMAIAQPPACWPMDATALAPSEDCLFVNVHLPTSIDRDTSKQYAGGLPVLAFVHGGGYKHGSAAWYPAERLVRDSGHKLIAVNIQYRLGVFGFLGGKDVKNDGALNAGILDQKFALEWIQKHIRAFGGDPSRVTIFGHSAGAGSVIQHLIAHDGESEIKLFQMAMMSSPYMSPQYNYDDPIIEGTYRALAERANCPIDDKTLSCLRSLDAGVLRDAGILSGGRSLFADFPPVVDGSYIRERPTATFAKKKVNAETLLVFANTNEAAIFVQPTEVKASMTAYISKMLPRLPEGEVDRAAQLYPGSSLTEMHQAAVQIKSEFFLVCPSYWALDAFSEKKSWKGTFAIPPAVHGLDLNYIFKDANIYKHQVTFPNDDFGRAFRHAYLSTAMRSSPAGVSGMITPMWPEYQYGGARTEMFFNKTEGGKPDVRAFQTDSGLQERCRFWHSVAEYTSQ